MAGVLIACVFGLTAWKVAWATTPQGFALSNIIGPVTMEEVYTKSKIGDHEATIKTKGTSDIYVSTITIQPGGHGGWHSHPGPSIIMVKSGEATIYDACHDPVSQHVYGAGTAFVEDAECVHIVQNEGTSVLEIVVLQIVPAGAPRRIDESAP